MNVSPFKLSSPYLIPWPGNRRIVRAYPLTKRQETSAEQETRDVFEAIGEPLEGVEYETERAARLLALSLRVDLEELFSEVYPLELALLYRRFETARAERRDRRPSARTWIRKRVNDDPVIMTDGAAAYDVDDPAAFFGSPVLNLASDQLWYFWTVRSAYDEFHVPNPETGRVKQATKEWLNRKE